MATQKYYDCWVRTGFEYENHIARKPVSSKKAIHQINETLRIQEVNGMFKIQQLQNDVWQYYMVEILVGHPQAAWWFSYDEALAVAQTLIESAMTSVEEETYEDMLAAQYNERLQGEVVYYTENSDQSERVARLIKASRDGVLLADPADPADQGCWYSFAQVSNIQRGRQYGWK
ncbi:MAG: hypothetical protein PVS3B3_32360 [Ktedonobacteraceae bacterium]